VIVNIPIFYFEISCKEKNNEKLVMAYNENDPVLQF